MTDTRQGEISFDTEVSEEGQHHIEGCFRLEGADWQVFYFTHRRGGEWWVDKPVEISNAIFRSGISGVDAVYPLSVTLNKITSMVLLSTILGGVTWDEVNGPDSLQLK